MTQPKTQTTSTGESRQSQRAYIDVVDLHKSFGTNRVLRGINFSLEQGKSMVILGGSGAGKSVLLRHLIGLHQPDSGQVWIDDTNMVGLTKKELFKAREHFGYAFQEGALFDSMTVFENVAFPMRRHRRNWSKSQIKDRVHNCLEMVGILDKRHNLPSEISGGMRRRVGFARSIALEPRILLFDEPTSGLDPIMTAVVDNIIISLREKLQITTLTITHDLDSAKRIATHVAMLFEGDLIEFGPKSSFFETDNPVVRQFLNGSPEGPATQAMMK